MIKKMKQEKNEMIPLANKVKVIYQTLRRKMENTVKLNLKRKLKRILEKLAAKMMII
jgi:hypothetical protein